MRDASLLADVDITYAGHKYEDAARGEEGVRVVRDFLRELYTLNRQ